MKLKIYLLLFIAFTALVQLQAKNYFIAPAGNDTTGAGTVDLPYRTIMKAHQLVVAGDTVFLRGGTYKMAESQINLKSSIYAYMNYLDKSGTSETKRICYWAYPGEKPVIDMSAVKPVAYRNIVFYIKGSWLHIKGIEIIGTQVTITTHTQSECFRNEGGSNNIYEKCVMRDGMAIGFYLTKGANNLVLNCDAYNNWDNVSESGAGGNVDGFGFHGNKGSTGNKISGCRAWLNSDDGYDCINNMEGVVFENCWAFYNGYSTGFVSRGDGNGFKVGGYGQAPVVSSLPSPIPSNTVRFCMAYRNKANGFYANHHVETGHTWYNNTAYRNSTNFNMLSQRITKSVITKNDTTLDCPGIRHLLHNNLSFKYSTQRDTLNLGTSTNQFNSFTSGMGVTVDANDFMSTTESLLIASRNPDGSLPVNGFLQLRAGSDLINKGKDIGFAFYGLAPDLGAFEATETTGISELAEKSNSIYPNPVKDMLYFRNMDVAKVEIYNLQGRLMIQTLACNELNVQMLPSGVYFVRITTAGKDMLMNKIIKL
ncbi:MAG: T9SS type A sorting domain-containing protein [Paludibacter sp.]